MLHSPLVGPGTWRLLLPVLQAARHEVVVPDLRPAMQGSGPYYPALIGIVHRAVRDLPAERTVFVAHSGAGTLIPYVAADGFAILLDALLPHPGRCWFDTAPEVLRTQLLASVRNGRVPPWHRWRPNGVLEPLLGDAYDGFAAEADDLPLGYFEESAPGDVPVLVPERCAYLQVSPSYDAEAAEAKARGWRTAYLSLNHLAMLTHSDEVGRALNALVRTFAGWIET
ncbi:MAG TPA: hypothetical protein VGG10_05040 [Rhizomicrobium sp.]